jgi:hypothetical protein
MIHLLDFNSTDSSIMLQNQLHQVKESSSMSDMLPELESSNPSIRIGLNSCARITRVPAEHTQQHMLVQVLHH